MELTCGVDDWGTVAVTLDGEAELDSGERLDRLSPVVVFELIRFKHGD